ncbi:hypothetical protein BH20ACT4_BH20ACT4_03670 [soil metagenome]
MSAGRVQAATEELYGLLPDEFTARRDALAKQARGDGDAETAKTVKALRRPTAPAWLVNLLVRQHGDDINRLLALGEDLRQAQSALDGQRMKQLSAERTTLVEALTSKAGKLGTAQGQKVTGAVERDLEETLRAAVVDPLAAEAVASGQLTRALSYAGLGEVDVSDATATPLERSSKQQPPHRKKTSPTEQGSSTDKRGKRQTESAKDREGRKDTARRAAAEQAAVEAKDRLEAATATVSATQQARHEAETLVTDLEQQLAEARSALAAAKKQHDQATRAHKRAERGASSWLASRQPWPTTSPQRSSGR